MVDTIQVWMVFELLLALAVWPFLVGAFLIVGSRPSRNRQATSRRLYRTAIAAATLAALPMLIWLVVLLPPYSAETSFSFAAALTAVSAFWTGRHLRRLMRGPYSAHVTEEEVSGSEHLQRVFERMGQEPPVVRTLAAENGTVLPGRLMGDSQRLNAYLPDDDSPETEKSRLLPFPLVIAYAPGEGWWQMAVVPIAAVSASCAGVSVRGYVAIAIGVVVFAIVKCLVNWVFRHGRGEGAEHYFV